MMLIKVASLILVTALGAGCGGANGNGSNSSIQPAVTVSPASVTLYPQQTQHFKATVSNLSNQSVTWTASPGSITSDGLYTAPTSGSSATITATSVPNSNYNGTASVTLAAAPSIAIQLESGYPVLPPGATDQFSATVTGASNSAVTWSASAGTITQNGLFTAPSVPDGTNIAITAASVADETVFAAYTLDITTQTVFASTSVSPTSASPGFDTFTVYWQTYNTSVVELDSVSGDYVGADYAPTGSAAFSTLFTSGQYSFELTATGNICEAGTSGSTCVYPTVTTYVPFTVTQ
jgi:hypothetical protein